MARSEGRTTNETKLLSSSEYNNALQSGYTALNHRFEVKSEKFCEEISELRHKISDYNLNGIGGLDDSDIEFLQDEIDESDSDAEFEAILPKPGIVITLKNEDNSDSEERNASIGDVLSTNNEQSAEFEEHNNLTENNVSSTSNEEDEEEVVAERESDVLSGSITFTENDIGDRYYTDFDAALRKAYVSCLIGWNMTHPFNTFFYDKRFIGVLLKEVFANQYAQVELSDKRMLFIKSLFDIRAKDDEDRRRQFTLIVKEKQAKANDKNSKGR